MLQNSLCGPRALLFKKWAADLTVKFAKCGALLRPDRLHLTKGSGVRWYLWRLPCSWSTNLAGEASQGVHLGRLIAGAQLAISRLFAVHAWQLHSAWKLSGFVVRADHAGDIDEVQQVPDAERLQFGIRHLLIVMGVASVLLGLGRFVVLSVGDLDTGRRGDSASEWLFPLRSTCCQKSIEGLNAINESDHPTKTREMKGHLMTSCPSLCSI